jgi:hypothetical protein
MLHLANMDNLAADQYFYHAITIRTPKAFGKCNTLRKINHSVFTKDSLW